MKSDDCAECAAFVEEMKAALRGLSKRTYRIRSREEVQQAVDRYVSLSEEGMMRLRESFAATNAGQIYARFIAASHHYRPH